MKRTSKILVVFVLVAITIVVFFCLRGCKREMPLNEPTKTSVDESDTIKRMEDPAYVKALEQHRETRRELLVKRQPLVKRMEAMIADAKGRLGTDDESVLKIELEKDPEWRSLYDRVVDINKAIEDDRLRASALVRDKILADQKKETSEK